MPSNQQNRRQGSARPQNRRNYKNRDQKRKPQGNASPQRNGSRFYSKMPRKQAKPSLWQRFLKLFGVGSPAKSKPKANAKSKPAPDTGPRLRKSTNPSKGQNKRETTQKREPEVVEVTSSRLYVGNLAYSASESDLMELFNGVGIVSSAEVVYHQRTQRSKGYAFVEMQSKDEALRAVEELHDKDYMGRKLVVSGAKASERNERKNVA